MKINEGSYDGKGKEIAIIIGRFNAFITEKLLEGALDCLIRHGVNENSISIFKVPGAFEIPALLSKILHKDNSKKYDGIITLAAIIRGDTPHFDFVASETSKGIAQLSLKSDIPVSYGVITADTTEQAIERAGTKSGNKGFDAALTLLEMMDLYKKI